MSKSTDTINTRLMSTVGGVRPTKTYAKTVIKRNGSEVPVAFDKITRRIKSLSHALKVEPSFVTQEVTNKMSDRMHVRDIDELAAEESASMLRMHPDYVVLASRIKVSNLHKETSASFSEAMEQMYHQLIVVPSPRLEGDQFLSKEFIDVVRKHSKLLDSVINHEADYSYDYFGMCTMINSYLTKIKSGSTFSIVERPQYLHMRVAIQLHSSDIQNVIRSYKIFSQRLYTHASPTLFNAGKPHPQMSSCFLLQIPDDSLSSIYDTLKQTAMISKHAGGIGLSVHGIRAKNALIKSSGCGGDGIVPMLRVYNNTARYVNQGGKRKGAFAIYLEPWHADIFDFLDLKKNRGSEEDRARDLHYAMWIPDLFMRRVESGESWSLFSPDTAPGLNRVWGSEFDTLYTKYESENRAVKVIPARDVWTRIIESQTETGEPYMLYKDACNRKSNQQNLGTIQSSNLCSEIIEYTSADEVAVCNLCSICLPSFVEDGKFNHLKLFDLVEYAAKNLDRVIDLNFYPIPEGKTSNVRHRPIGIGVQGLADVFCMLRLPYESPGAAQLNREIFETIYYGALCASCNLAHQYGAYSSYEGSPASKGQLQFDLWGVEPSDRWDWTGLRQQIADYGLRNSLSVAIMPTAQTSTIMNCTEACEPFTRNLYVRRTLSGDFLVLNKHLTQHLLDANLWSIDIVNKIIANGGSVQSIDELPQYIKDLFKTSFEIKMKAVIDLATGRGPFICQSQSMNLFVSNPSFQVLNSIHMYAWKCGLKTGMYYLHSGAAASAQQVVISHQESQDKAEQKKIVCTDEVCTSCSA